MTARKVTDKPDLAVLDPQAVVHTIGGKDFEQMPLVLADLGALLGLVFEVLALATSTTAIDDLNSLDLKTEEGRTAAIPAMMNLFILMPTVMPRFVAACLGVTDLEDVELIRTKCKPSTLLRILDTFLDQNEPEELLASFFALKGKFQKVKAMM